MAKKVGGGYDPDFQAWINFNIDEGNYLPDTTRLDAGNQFVLDSKANGDWDGKDREYLLAWNDLDCEDCSLVCLKSLATMIPSGGMTYTLKGWKGNGSNGYIATGFTPADDGVNYTLDEAGKGVLISEHIDGNAATGSVNSNSHHSMLMTDGGNSVYQRMNMASPHSPGIPYSGTGLKTQYIDDSTTTRGYNNGSSVTATCSTSPSSMDYEICLFKRGSGYFSKNTIGEFFLSKSFNEEKNEGMEDSLNSFLVSIGLTAFA